MTYKSRSFISGSLLADQTYYGSPRNHWEDSWVDFESQDTISSGKDWRKRLGSSDIGNNWIKEGWTCINSGKYTDVTRGAWRYFGDSWAYPGRDASLSSNRGLYWPALPTGGINMFSAGATAISRCAPTVPASDTLVALAEIVREGLPRVGTLSLSAALQNAGSRKGLRLTPKAVSDEYLNYQFGWKPFLNDLRKLSKAIYESEDLISQLQRNSGKITRRSYTFPDVTYSSTSGTTAKPYPSPYSTLVSSTTRMMDESSSIETWFNGAFTYHADLRGSTSWERVEDAAKTARLLYGIKLSPDVVWNLMPWSWVIDWQTNIGDVLTNVGLFSNDGLVMHYGYVMQHLKAERHYYMKPTWYGGFSPYLSSRLITEKKQRVRASPWGFGLELGDLSLRQMSILTALGISRV